MKIDLRKLSAAKSASVPFSETLDCSAEEFYGEKPFTEPAKLTGTVSGELGVLHFRGRIDAVYQTACARCLKPLSIPISAEADTVLTDDPNAEEDENLFVLTESDSIDPADVLLPELFLNIDMTYLCSPDCKGLCPMCGINRNEASCDCEQKQIDPRFAALRALLDK